MAIRDERDTLAIYLREVRKIPLLTKPDEMKLVKKIELGVAAGKKFQKAKRKKMPLSRDQESTLAIAICSGREARQALIEANLRLVVSIAKEYRRHRTMSLQDLIQEGNLALFASADKFNRRRGTVFSTYASLLIHQSIKKAIINQARTIKITKHAARGLAKYRATKNELSFQLGRKPLLEEIAREMACSIRVAQNLERVMVGICSLEVLTGKNDADSLDIFIQDSHASNVDENFSLTEVLEQAFTGLTEQEKEILQMRYGLKNGKSCKDQEIKEKFSITGHGLRKIHTKALKKLRQNKLINQLQ